MSAMREGAPSAVLDLLAPSPVMVGRAATAFQASHGAVPEGAEPSQDANIDDDSGDDDFVLEIYRPRHKNGNERSNRVLSVRQRFSGQSAMVVPGGTALCALLSVTAPPATLRIPSTE